MLMIVERTKDGLGNSEVKEMIETMDKELTTIIEDFMRAVDIEALYLAKKIGKHSLSHYSNSSFSMVSYRGRAFTWAAQPCRRQLRLEPRLYERHPPIYPSGNYGMGNRTTGETWCITGQYLLVLRLTRNRKNIVGSFNL